LLKWVAQFPAASSPRSAKLIDNRIAKLEFVKFGDLCRNEEEPPMGKAAVGTGTGASERSQPLSAIIRAAQYVRMSREHQKYSIANQSAANHVYAAQHRLEIVRTYSDEGRSGLSLNRRAALKQLIADVQTGQADFKAIIVYDVSR
jgi:Resolvase, N terminal domain